VYCGRSVSGTVGKGVVVDCTYSTVELFDTDGAPMHQKVTLVMSYDALASVSTAGDNFENPRTDQYGNERDIITSNGYSAIVSEYRSYAEANFLRTYDPLLAS
jgi:hypothetical protein